MSDAFVAKLTSRKGLTPAQIRTAVRFAGLAGLPAAADAPAQTDGKIALEPSPIEKLIVTNSIPLDSSKQSDKIVQLSVAKLLGEAIARIHYDSSVSELFE